MSLLSNDVLKAFVKISLVSIDDLKQKYFQKWIYITLSLLLFYFILGELVFSLWDGLNGLDALFLVVTTFSTVGYGIYAPSTSGIRLFTSAYIIFGIGVGSALIGALNDRYNKRKGTHKTQIDIENHTVNQLSLLDTFRQSLRATSIRIDQFIFGSTPATPQEALEEYSDSDSESNIDNPLPSEDKQENFYDSDNAKYTTTSTIINNNNTNNNKDKRNSRRFS